MEVGAVKQAFNNELIKLKKNFNQAKIQIIHKLTRKAKMYSLKKVPENLQEKLKRKSEYAVKEVLIIKKIKVRDVAKFALTCKDDLITQLNKPNVDIEKACARLLLHKSLNQKYKFLKDRFGSVPINDLLMSRQERRNLKKESKERKKNQNKVKIGNFDQTTSNVPNEANFENDKNYESHDSDIVDIKKHTLEIKQTDDTIENQFYSDMESTLNKELMIDNVMSDSEKDSGYLIKSSAVKKEFNHAICKKNKPIAKSQNDLSKPDREPKSITKKTKDNNKNKNLNKKLLHRNFKNEDNIIPLENKVVDPFFITETGDNYLTVTEPRQPDEIKEHHRQGNRRQRRAVIFGHALPYQPKKESFRNSYYKEPRQEKFGDNISDLRKKDSSTNQFLIHTRFPNTQLEEVKVKEKDEKLHPSWEAKKKQSGILPFQGKKIVFSES